MLILLLLFLFWLILSGKLTVEIAVFGLLVSLVVWLFMCRFLGWDVRRELRFYRISPHIAAYVLVLIYEIIKANIAVLPYVFGVRKPDGRTVEFESPLSGAAANAVLANSITLTPGTITVSVDGGRFTVHCLAPAFAEGIERSVFVRRLLKMEKLLKGEKS